MVQDFKSAEGDAADIAVPVAQWRAYASIERFGDYDGPVGDELSIPIIYEPG